MTQQADEIQAEVMVPLAAGSDKESRRRKAHTTSRSRHQDGASDIDACTQRITPAGVTASGPVQPTFAFNRQIAAFRIEANVTHAQ
jgi:hypothetical protein